MKQACMWGVSLIFVVLMLGVAVWIYPHLPAQTPIHWDAHDNVNGWMPRFWAAAIWPLVMLGLTVAYALLPVISPRKFEFARSDVPTRSSCSRFRPSCWLSAPSRCSLAPDTTCPWIWLRLSPLVPC